jgi:hypothetical protein
VAATPILPTRSVGTQAGSTTEARRKVTEPVIGEVVQPGYVHEGMLLRPARVVVVQPASRPKAEA